jgi:serine/threonine protein kinase
VGRNFQENADRQMPEKCRQFSRPESPTSHLNLEMHVPDFSMCREVSGQTNYPRGLFVPGTMGNNENLTAMNTTDLLERPNPAYIETTERFEDITVSGNRFPRLKELGRGGFGVVFESQDPASGQKVALKVMQYDLDDSKRRMFDREVEILASVKHETLLGMRGFMPFSRASSSNPPLIVTELMARGSLQSVISDAGKGPAPFNWDDTAKWIVIYGTAVGMMTLHANHIIHCDLKPDNVLLADDLTPKVGDFGLGKFLSAGSLQQSIHGGTPGFMAPETYGGNCTLASDVFSFGMLVYMTLTGSHPFPNKTPFAIGESICRGDRPSIPANIGLAYRELMQKCLDASPDNRPTFASIVDGLESANFWTSSTHAMNLARYQARILPERATPLIERSSIVNELFGGRREEIFAVGAAGVESDMSFLDSMEQCVASFLPGTILYRKLVVLNNDHSLAINPVLRSQVSADEFEEIGDVIAHCQYAFNLGLRITYYGEGVDLYPWLRNNYQRKDIVSAFATLYSDIRRERRQRVIGQLTRLVRESPQIIGYQDKWDALVRRARSLRFGSCYLSLPDSELYTTIPPESVQICIQ